MSLRRQLERLHEAVAARIPDSCTNCGRANGRTIVRTPGRAQPNAACPECRDVHVVNVRFVSPSGEVRT